MGKFIGINNLQQNLNSAAQETASEAIGKQRYKKQTWVPDDFLNKRREFIKRTMKKRAKSTSIKKKIIMCYLKNKF